MSELRKLDIFLEGMKDVEKNKNSENVEEASTYKNKFEVRQTEDGSSYVEITPPKNTYSGETKTITFRPLASPGKQGRDITIGVGINGNEVILSLGEWNKLFKVVEKEIQETVVASYAQKTSTKDTQKIDPKEKPLGSEPFGGGMK
jgi:hypothetical protein